ncbi:MAG: short-chain dehydrogenase/reductase [Herminiimonas sp.]|nr:short-chain dehydrogenase/reductase [Herminiimonas sp.]
MQPFDEEDPLASENETSPHGVARPPFPAKPQQLPGSDAAMAPRADHGEQSYRGSGRLQGKRAIITGGDSGIGRAVALAFAREGADVLIAYLNEDEDARETARLVEAAGRKAVLVPGDIGQESHCRDIVGEAMNALGGIDVLVNNAAFQTVHQSIAELPSEEFDRTFRTNVYGMFYLSKAALPHMKPGSAIINTTSVQAYEPTASLLAYASTKGAIVTFTKALAQEAIARGVRVNAVAPGPVWTPLIPASMPSEQVSQFGSNTPLGRPAQPAELAPAYVFLASAETSSYVVGEVLGVTGGSKILP